MQPFLLLFLWFMRGPSPASGDAVIKKMYETYHHHWYHDFTFHQTTEMYRNDSLRGTQTWHEAMLFPDRFRIDFGDLDSGNAVIYKGDSSYSFRKGMLRGARKDPNDIVFLLGGMYFMEIDKVLGKMKEFGYDLNKFHEDTWKGKPVYVIGAAKGEDQVNQLWIDRDKLYIVRLISFANNRKEEVLLEDHMPLGGGYTETKTIVYLNDKLVQVEKYYDCKEPAQLDPRIFEPGDFGKVHWARN